MKKWRKWEEILVCFNIDAILFCLSASASRNISQKCNPPKHLPFDTWSVRLSPQSLFFGKLWYQSNKTPSNMIDGESENKHQCLSLAKKKWRKIKIKENWRRWSICKSGKVYKRAFVKIEKRRPQTSPSLIWQIDRHLSRCGTSKYDSNPIDGIT